MPMKSLAFCLCLACFSYGCASANAISGHLKRVAGDDIEDVTLRPSKMEDQELEAAMVEAYKEAGWPEDVKGLTITASDWTIKRHDVTGVITHRSIPVDMVVQAEGKSYCRYFSVSYKQEYNGSDYGKTMYGGTGNTAAVDCEKSISTDNN